MAMMPSSPPIHLRPEAFSWAPDAMRLVPKTWLTFWRRKLDKRDPTLSARDSEEVEACTQKCRAKTICHTFLARISHKDLDIICKTESYRVVFERPPQHTSRAVKKKSAPPLGAAIGSHHGHPWVSLESMFRHLSCVSSNSAARKIHGRKNGGGIKLALPQQSTRIAVIHVLLLMCCEYDMGIRNHTTFVHQASRAGVVCPLIPCKIHRKMKETNRKIKEVHTKIKKIHRKSMGKCKKSIGKSKKINRKIKRKSKRKMKEIHRKIKRKSMGKSIGNL
jgi:hypothetical protein